MCQVNSEIKSGSMVWSPFEKQLLYNDWHCDTDFIPVHSNKPPEKVKKSKPGFYWNLLNCTSEDSRGR